MPLQSVDSPARDEGFEIGFLMADGDRQVRCYAQRGALDAIEPGRTKNGKELLERFQRHRAAFEHVASSLHDAGLYPRITSSHLKLLQALVGREPTTWH